MDRSGRSCAACAGLARRFAFGGEQGLEADRAIAIARLLGGERRLHPGALFEDVRILGPRDPGDAGLHLVADGEQLAQVEEELPGLA